jgi:hypothetical protein
MSHLDQNERSKTKDKQPEGVKNKWLTQNQMPAKNHI